MTIDVAAIGTLNVDILLHGTAPRDFDQLARWTGLGEVTLTTAGSVGYTAQDLAKLGLKVGLMSCVGDDIFGAFILDEMKDKGIDTEWVQVEEGMASAVGIYPLLFGGNKRPAAGRLASHAPWPLVFNKAQLDYLSKARLLHCGGYLHYPQVWGEPTETIYKFAKECGLLTSIDSQFPTVPVEGPWIKAFGNLLRYVDILFMDEYEARSTTGCESLNEAAEVVRAQGTSTVVIKRGAKGCIVTTADKSIELPAFPVNTNEIIDAVGAGDAFDAGFLAGILAGWDEVKAGRLASHVATYSLKSAGGSLGVPENRIEDLI